MSVLEHQNILGGGQGARGAMYEGARRLSFGPAMSKKGAAGSSEAGAFLYNSPSRSYAADTDARDTFSQPTGISPLGLDGTAIVKGNNTKYGGDTDGVVARMTNGDTSLLTGLAKVISGRPKQPKYEAMDYFTTRTPRASRSFHNTLNPGGNKGGSGTARAFYYAGVQYPDEILTNSSGAEYVPAMVDGVNFLSRVIPITPGGDETGGEPDSYEFLNQQGNGEGETDESGEHTSGDQGVDPTSEVDSVVEIEVDGGGGVDPTSLVEADLKNSEGGDATVVHDQSGRSTVESNAARRAWQAVVDSLGYSSGRA